MEKLWEYIISEAGTAALLGAVFGGIVIGVANYLLERRRETSRLKLDLLLVRREVELAGLEAAHHMAVQFKTFFLHNHEKRSKKADKAQAQSIDELGERAEELKIIALRVNVLASKKVASLMQKVPDRIFEYFDDAQNDQKIYAQKANAALEDIHIIMERLKSAVREDVQTELID